MLKISKLSKYFGRGTVNEVLALDNLSLHVSPGEFVCVIGSNGSGKSTLMGCVSGNHQPDDGRIDLNGEDITLWPEYKRAKKIGRVFQDPLSGTCASMTIMENMALANRRGLPRTLRLGVTKKERLKFQTALARLDLGLEDRLADKVGLLSGGQRQSLTLLMSTLLRPTILLLDEHTAALDPKTANLVMELTRDIVEKENLTTIMITHNMQQALSYGTRLIMMHRGKFLLDFNAKEKARLSVEDLLHHFHAANPTFPGQPLTDQPLTDQMVLA
ncbi:MAG: ATP-binding cassette domain-containing protein [Deltaproteobacteria bacterium]|jgi:putative ABC transport system ATP-binding protein|nr:ATP-binding cassette domain-containing protein [Deltaproteobacteria bacterium]